MPDAATANLALPLLQAAQAQKHVTHNEALVALDTLVQLAVLDKDLTAPPASPTEGDRYLIAGASPTGAWAGWGTRVVRYQDGAWRSFVPRPGWLAFVADEADLYTYTGVAWASFRSTLTALQNLTRLGIGTTADAANPFAAKLNKALWTALTTAEGGTGDLRYTLNKQASANTLSLLMQSGFSGRAEIGLTGDDDLRLKVSADGGTWREALRVDRATGGLDLTAAEASAPIAGTVDLGALPALRVALTGTGTVTSFGTVPNRVRLLRFTGAATLTHNAASLVLPGGASLVTAPGDTALATSDASGNWTVRDYLRASGKPVTGPAAAEITDASATGRTVLTGSPSDGSTALGVGPANIPNFAGVNVVSSGDGAVYFESGAAPPNTYRRKVLLSSPNVGGGNDILIRSSRPSDGAVLDYVLAASAPGTILTTGSGGVSPTFSGLTIRQGNGVGGYLEIGSSNGGANDEVLAFRTAFPGTAGSKLVGRIAAAPDTGTGGRLMLDTPGLDGVLRRAIHVDAYQNVGIGGGASSARLNVAGAMKVTAEASFGTTVQLGTYIVSTLPAGVFGGLVHVSNARKVGEASGSGTGVIAYYSNGNWRRLSDDSPVAA